MLFADVILPLAIPKLYTYHIPENLKEKISVGQRAVVQFGEKAARLDDSGSQGGKLYSALVKNIHGNAPVNYTAKDIEYILDTAPLVNEKQFALWDWMSSYYMCGIGEIMNAALPSGLKLSSETKILRNPDIETAHQDLSDDEFLISEALETNHSLTIQDACEILGRKTIYPIIKSLLEKKAVVIEEELKEKYKPKLEQYIRLNENLRNENNLKKIFDGLEKAPRQLELLMMYVQLSRIFTDKLLDVKKRVLQKSAGATAGTLNTLIEKNIFELYEKEAGRFQDETLGETRKIQLNEKQAEALKNIRGLFLEKEVVLLHGVTSSGKTEAYIRLIEETLQNGRQALYLLPEIALTTQIISRLTKHFGKNISVYHSKFSSNERVEIWENLRKAADPKTTHHQLSAANLVIGARSALFLPYSNLGLIIVDEEHENSFKQFDPAPRYHARDAALVLAKIHGAKTLLGSATPAIETYFNAKSGKFGLVEMAERFGGIQLPEIFVSDIKEASRKKIMKSHFSPLLLDEIQKALDNKEQVILFQNRRGFAPYLQCSTCAAVPQCSRCDVKLTYHKHFNELRCHYCGYRMPNPKACPACGDINLKLMGFGTEKIEEELLLFFPDIKTGRLDLDTTRSKSSYRQIISDFEERNIDVLVGTQMVTKGLDFDNVALVGILNADNMLYFPDFRAHERSFQLMAQVAGRAGRKNKRGKVIIQTYSPTHHIIQNVLQNDYAALYNAEIIERNNFHYPPFCRLIEITLKHREAEKAAEAAEFLANQLRKKFGKRVLGPEAPLVGRVKNLYLKNIMLKIEREASAQKAKDILREELTDFKKEEDFKQVRISIDVDPM